MRGDAIGFAARAMLALWALAAGAAVIVGMRKGQRRGAAGYGPPPRPSREGPDALAALLKASARGSFARERIATRIASIARDIIALERGLDDAAARRAARSGALDASPTLREYIERDYLIEPRDKSRLRWPLVRAPRDDGGEFLRNTEDALNELKKLRAARRGAS